MMREHFGRQASMRTTFPWSRLVTVYGLFLAATWMNSHDGVWVYLSYMGFGASIGLAMDFGEERYRWSRYRRAKRNYDHYMQANEGMERD